MGTRLGTCERMVIFLFKMAVSASESDQMSVEVKAIHALVKEALNCDEQGRFEDALHLYQQCQRRLDSLLLASGLAQGSRRRELDLCREHVMERLAVLFMNAPTQTQRTNDVNAKLLHHVTNGVQLFYVGVSFCVLQVAPCTFLLCRV